ncbi:Photoreceptor outer segment membrane glycoprotein 2 [Mizuhopecten yessoensis]|uniref:Photoreceptor outer segment membrane glycoprotein 2 n=1 Tax=Mizuhopecten yessoensis TaxID=6573 RepID=A0A210PP04_MIZYE|nr:Photoreceptor outer segment membrane glycoprotein 2 [Mizuhopecten yessoensis]
MCITFNIPSNVREKIAITICILNSLIALFGIALIGMAVYMKINIDSRMMLLDGYDTDVLPYFLLAVGIKVVILHIVTFKIVYDCSTSEMSGRCVNFLFLAVILSFILVWFLLAGGLMCFTHRSVIEESLQNGLGYVMKRYKTDMFVKVTLDKLQQEYHCCGSNGYSDWFDVNWVNEEFLNTKHPDIIRKLKGGLFYSDDVPYSCCDVTSPRPCVHHAVKDKSMHVHYGSVTLYQSGCSNVLMDFFENRILVPTGWSVISAFLLQFVTLVLMRYLQTSMADARDMEDPEGEGAGYCCPGCPCDCCSPGDPMKYVKPKRCSSDDIEDGKGGTAPEFDFEDSSGRDNSTDKNKEDKRNRRKDKKDKKGKDKKDKTRKDKSKER